MSLVLLRLKLKQSEMDRKLNCRFCKKSLISGKRINTVPVFGSVVLAQAFESSRFALEQGESFSDLSCLTCSWRVRVVRLASSVSNLTSPCNERTWNAKGTDTIMTSPECEPPKTSTKRSAALRSPTRITPLGIYPVFIAIKGGSRPTRHLPHAKMLLIPISLHFHWANVILAACFTLRGHGIHIDLLWFLSLVGRICPLMQEHFLWPLLKHKPFF